MGLHAETVYSFSVDFGGYFTGSFSTRLVVDIDDALTAMTCKAVDATYSYQLHDTSGYGFINAAGIQWAVPHADMWFANPDDQGPETWDAVKAQFLQVQSNWESTVINGAYARDDGSGYQGQVTGPGTFVRQLTRDDFDENGQLKDIALTTYWQRYRDADVSAARCNVSVGNGSGGIDMGYLEWPYTPFATRSGSTWVSLNNEGHNLLIRRNGAYGNVRNDLYDNGKTQGFIRSHGEWTKSPLFRS